MGRRDRCEVTDDELREILGEATFQDLSDLAADMINNPDCQLELDDEMFERMESRIYHIVIPMRGELIMDLAAKLMHSSTECEDCADDLAKFTAFVITTIWNAMIETERMLDE